MCTCVVHVRMYKIVWHDKQGELKFRERELNSPTTNNGSILTPNTKAFELSSAFSSRAIQGRDTLTEMFIFEIPSTVDWEGGSEDLEVDWDSEVSLVLESDSSLCLVPVSS